MEPVAAEGAPPSAMVRGRLFRKYVGLFLIVVSLALIPKGFLDVWLSYQELSTLLVRIQSEQAKSAAERIAQFVREIEGQMAGAAQLPVQSRSDSEWRFDAVRLLRQVPALTEIAQLDGNGRERFRMSRQAMDVIGSMRDFSQDPIFVQAMSNKIYYGPIYFVHQSEPYMTIAVANGQRDFGVFIGQINLKFIWDVVSKIKVGIRGQAYVVDEQGRLIAHPDISLVLRNTDMSRLVQVKAARDDVAGVSESSDHSSIATDLQGRKVLSAFARVSPLGWLVFAEMPIDEALAPLYDTLIRSALLLVAGLGLAFLAGLFLARKMVIPIRTLSEGAERIGAGDLAQRIAINTGDELESLGNEFNRMASRLQESYATLEHKVEERTRQLEAANLAKSRFLAAASHDLRQPLHALGLFVAQLGGRMRAEERQRIIARITAALSAMNELFSALLDVSKLEAGALAPSVTDFSVSLLLQRIESTFGDAAQEQDLAMRVVDCDAWVRSDFIFLERIVSNLVSNAIRYTERGRVLVGCRRRGDRLRIEVWDTGAGVPADQYQYIFTEFCRLGKPDRDKKGGLGLGLAIVERLCRLLNHSVELTSVVGNGSCFSVSIPIAPVGERLASPTILAQNRFDISLGKLVVVIDDDRLVLDGMSGLLKKWGCIVVTAQSELEASSSLRLLGRFPDIVISDYHLCDGITGVEAIASLSMQAGGDIPAFLMSGDTDRETLRQAQANGYLLLHKPVDPMVLRAALTQVLTKHRVARMALQPAN